MSIQNIENMGGICSSKMYFSLVSGFFENLAYITITLFTVELPTVSFARILNFTQLLETKISIFSDGNDSIGENSTAEIQPWGLFFTLFD